ncbi:MAG: ABC transporter ATP-binding protein [Candidatus Eremiobacteraeota bacterium]|nr:ABC transporter ATP-binding protein [Candidatus Eremiobacteraeota bacterium]
MVDVREASKIYEGGVVALDSVTLSVAPGDFVALLGPSGCGKSTLLNLFGAIDLPTSGSVRIAGKTTSDLSDDELTLLRRDKVGTIFQFFNLVPTLTIWENVALPLLLQGCPRNELRERVASAIDRVALNGRASAYPAQASGGELQRAAIARAVIHVPALVLADEPTGNLDSQNGENVLRLLREIADAGQTIVMATHSTEAAGYADRAVRMRDGKIVT